MIQQSVVNSNKVARAISYIPKTTDPGVASAEVWNNKIGTYSGTVVAETAFGQSSTAGVAAGVSRGDHTHGSPVDPSDDLSKLAFILGA